MRTVHAAPAAALLLLSASLACAGEKSDAAGAAGKDAAATAAQQAAPGSSPPSQEGQAPPPPEAQPPTPGTAPADAAAPVARVNGVPISERELQEGLRAVMQAQGMPPNTPPEQLGQVRNVVLDALIGSELVFQKGKGEGLAPGDKEIDDALAQARGQFPSEEAWQTNLQARGLDEAGMRSLIVHNMTINKTVQTTVVDKIVVSDAEVNKYYDEHPQEMLKAEEVRASHILIRLPQQATDEQKTAARARADEALKKAKAGEDFAGLAKTYSEDPGSAQNGGDLGFFGRGRMVGPFEDAAFSLAAGKLSEVVESPFGYHVIKVTEKHEASQVPLTEVQENLRNFLKQRQAREQVQNLLDTLRAAAKVEIY